VLPILIFSEVDHRAGQPPDELLHVPLLLLQALAGLSRCSVLCFLTLVQHAMVLSKMTHLLRHLPPVATHHRSLLRFSLLPPLLIFALRLHGICGGELASLRAVLASFFALALQD
jgi:hypothetical protein